MPLTRYRWHEGPPPAPAVYLTCLTSERDSSLRYYDGERWWGLDTRGSKGRPFTWPKRGISKPKWLAKWEQRNGRPVGLRHITDQSVVRWGEPYKYFEPPEVLAYLVRKGVLPEDWKECFQEEMRNASSRTV